MTEIRAAFTQEEEATVKVPLATESAVEVSHDALSTSFVATLDVKRRAANANDTCTRSAALDVKADELQSFAEIDAFLIAASVERSYLATHLELIDTEHNDGVAATNLIGVELPRAKEEASAAASVKESRGEKVTRCEGGVGDGVAAAPRRTSNRETAVADNDGEADESMCCDASDAGVATCAVA